MKKTLLLILIMISCAQFCYAQVEAETKGPLAPLAPLIDVPMAEASAQNTPAETTETVEPTEDTDSIENINSYFTDDSKNVELNGYAQYNEEQEQTEAPAIYLEDSANGHGINFTAPKKVGSKALAKKPTFQPIQDELEAASKFSTQEYNIKPVSTSYSRKFGQFSFGTMYNSSMDSARANYSTGLFTKYEGKYFALSSGFSKSTNSNYDAYSDKIFFSPELKLTKRLSLLNVMKTDVFQINKSSEFVLRYTPHMKKYADDVQFEVGAGQTFHEDTYINSSLRFSTNFKI